MYEYIMLYISTEKFKLPIFLLLLCYFKKQDIIESEMDLNEKFYSCGIFFFK